MTNGKCGALVERRESARAGITILELLIAMTVFLVFLASLFALFITANRTNARVVQQTTMLQEGEGVIRLITYEASLAGFRGTSSSVQPQFDVPPGASECDAASLCVSLGTVSDALSLRFFEVDGPAVGFSELGEQWVTYSVNQDQGVLVRRDEFAARSDPDGNPNQGLAGGVESMRVLEFVLTDRREPISAARAVCVPPTEIAGVRVRVEFTDPREPGWSFLVGLYNPVSVVIVGGVDPETCDELEGGEVS